MKLPNLAVLLTAVVLTGCTTSYSPDIQSYRRPFEEGRTDLIVDNLLEAKDQTRDMVWLNALRVFKNADEHQFYLELIYATTTDTGYLDIGTGPSLILTVDGKEMQFSGTGTTNMRRKKGALLNETALYPVSAKDLVVIGNARQIKVRIVGQGRIVEREFSTVNISRFKKFVDQFISAGS
jgi:hypothetical protein